MRNLVLLGATGSIGENTLRVVRAHPDRLKLIAVAANLRWQRLASIVHEFAVPHVAIFDSQAFEEARASGDFPPGTQFHRGMEGLETVASLPEANLVADAIVGTLSLKPALAALAAGKDLALASKEILVMAGKFVTRAAKQHGAAILPLDSEHNAIFQCLQGSPPEAVAKLILTASGGPFRDFSDAQMAKVTRAEALTHPNWDMGPKVTVDSSTMANKGLEVIEAHWLFGMARDQLAVVVHPQSIVHSMVQFVDGSVLAHLSPPIMTFAIQHALLYPDRAAGVDAPLDFTQVMQLDFRPPNWQRFPCLRLAMEALEVGGIAPAVFNAANEVAVEAFLADRVNHAAIPKIIAHALESVPACDPETLDEVIEADAEARRQAASCPVIPGASPTFHHAS